MQPPQHPGPYGGPPFPGPQGPPPSYPPTSVAPPNRSRRGPLVIVVVVVVLLAVAVAGAGGLLYARGSHGESGFAKTPAACWLLSQEQVREYVPGAVLNGSGDAYLCRWSKPVGTPQTGLLTVAVETLPGDRPSFKDAKEQYAIRRRQADEPGVVITPLANGDESFMACASPSNGGPGNCKTYTRVGNVVFSLEFESYPVPGVRDPGPSVRALDAEAVRHLRQSG